MAFDTFLGMLGSLVTLEEAAKNFLLERPEQAQREELENFRAYLSETNQKEILTILESVIVALLEVKEIGSSSELKIDKLIEYARETREFKQGKPIVEIVEPTISTGDYMTDGPKFRKVQPKVLFKIRNLGDAPIEKYSFQVETVSGMFSTHASGMDIRRFFISQENGNDYFCIDERTTNRIEAGQAKNLFVGMTVLDGKTFKDYLKTTIMMTVFSEGQKHEKAFSIEQKISIRGKILTIGDF